MNRLFYEIFNLEQDYIRELIDGRLTKLERIREEDMIR